ncbi:MAG: hypothetical protein AAFQ54_01575 [Pseudomonadota bacterium]
MIISALAPIGVVITLVGLSGLGYCIASAARAKAAKLDDEAMRARLAQLIPWNLGSLAVSALGIAMLVIGLALR